MNLNRCMYNIFANEVYGGGHKIRICIKTRSYQNENLLATLREFRAI